MSTPDLTRKVIGFRSWRLTGGELRPQNDAFSAWKVGANRARCEKDAYPQAGLIALLRYADDTIEAPEPPPSDHDAPHAGCDCGYYAWHSLERVIGLGPCDGFIHGAVAAWGRMEVHADGFRAEYAQPVVFGYSDTYTVRSFRAAEDFAREHGVRLVPLDELPEFASVFGAPVPENLRPEKKAGLERPGITLAQGAYYIAPGGYIQSNHFSGVTISGVTWTHADESDEDRKDGPVHRARRKFTGRSGEEPPKFPARRKGRG